MSKERKCKTCTNSINHKHGAAKFCNKVCKQAYLKEYVIRYKKENKEKVKEFTKTYYKKNKERLKKYYRSHYENNKEKKKRKTYSKEKLREWSTRAYQKRKLKKEVKDE